MLDIDIEFASYAELNVPFHFVFMVSGLQRMASNIPDMTSRLSIHDETSGTTYFIYLPVNEITKSSSTFSATSVSNNIVW